MFRRTAAHVSSLAGLAAAALVAGAAGTALADAPQRRLSDDTVRQLTRGAPAPAAAPPARPQSGRDADRARPPAAADTTRRDLTPARRDDRNGRDDRGDRNDRGGRPQNDWRDDRSNRDNDRDGPGRGFNGYGWDHDRRDHDDRGHGGGTSIFVGIGLPPRPVVVERPVIVQRPVVVERPVVIERPVIVARPVEVSPAQFKLTAYRSGCEIVLCVSGTNPTTGYDTGLTAETTAGCNPRFTLHNHAPEPCELVAQRCTGFESTARFTADPYARTVRVTVAGCEYEVPVGGSVRVG